MWSARWHLLQKRVLLTSVYILSKDRKESFFLGYFWRDFQILCVRKSLAYQSLQHKVERYVLRISQIICFHIIWNLEKFRVQSRNWNPGMPGMKWERGHKSDSNGSQRTRSAVRRRSSRVVNQEGIRFIINSSSAENVWSMGPQGRKEKRKKRSIVVPLCTFLTSFTDTIERNLTNWRLARRTSVRLLLRTRIYRIPCPTTASLCPLLPHYKIILDSQPGNSIKTFS